MLEYQEADFVPAVWQAGVYKEQRYGIPLDIHPLLFYYTRRTSEGRPERGPRTRRASRPPSRDEGQGRPGPVLGHLDLAGPPDVVVADLPVRHPLQRGRLPGAVQLRGRRPGPHLAGQQHPAGLQPQERGQRRPGDRLPAGQERPHLGRHLDDERVGQDQEPGLGCGAASADRLAAGRLGQLHNFAVTSQAQKDPNKLQAAKAFIAYISDHSIDWAKSGQVPARASVRRARSSRPSRSSRSPPRSWTTSSSPGGGGHRRCDHADLRAGGQRGGAGQEVTQGRPGRGDQQGQPCWPPTRRSTGVAAHDDHRCRRPGRRPPARRRPAAAGAGGSAPVGRRGRRPGPLPVPGPLPDPVRPLHPGALHLRHLDQPARLGLPAARQAVRRPPELRRPVHAGHDHQRAVLVVDAGHRQVRPLQRAPAGDHPAGRGRPAQPEVPRPRLLPGPSSPPTCSGWR